MFAFWPVIIHIEKNNSTSDPVFLKFNFKLNARLIGQLWRIIYILEFLVWMVLKELCHDIFCFTLKA